MAPSRLRTARPLIMALEPRLMFDGAAVDTAIHALSVADSPQTAAPAPPVRNEIAFIDGGLKDLNILAQGMRDGVEVHVLDVDRDGLEQMTEVLQGRSNVDAIHVISHGAEGQVQLGTTVLSLSNLDPRGADLRQIGQALTADGDILLYGCDVGQGTIGGAFVGRLGLITGADIASSVDATGTPGNWTLEHGTGAIEATAALSDAAQAAYVHTLAFPAGWGNGGAATGNSMAVDGSGNVYTTGYFSGTVDFDPAGGTTYNLTSTGGNDIFVQKLDATGALVWAVTMGAAGADVGRGIAVDGSGNVYTTGHFSGTVDFDPATGTTNNLTSAGGIETFVQKLDANGALVWAARIGLATSDTGTDIAVDGSGNVYWTGGYNNSDYVVQKRNANGAVVWSKLTSGGGTELGNGIAVDGSGNVYTTGYFSGTIDFDPGAGTTYNLTSAGGTDTFVQKLDANGALVWARAMGGVGADVGKGIAVDGSGNVYTTGSFTGTGDFDPGAGTTYNLTSAGGTDTFVQKLDATGALVWARAMGGAAADTGTGLAVGSSYVYTTGSFTGTADFDPGAGTRNLIGGAGTNAFVSRLDLSGNFVVVNNSPTGAVSVSGTATQGQTLTGSNTLADADGLGAVSYQWQSSPDGNTWSAINGATASTFTLTQAQVGRQVRVVASYTDGQNTAESVASGATAAVANPDVAPIITSPPPPPPPPVVEAPKPAPPKDSGPVAPLVTVVRDNTPAPTTFQAPAAPVVTQTQAPAAPTLAPTGAQTVQTIPATLTAPSAQAFQVAVAVRAAGGGDALVVNAPVRDSVIAEGTRIAVTVPSEAFAHTKADATVTLTATRDTGAALPAWMAFNPQTGTFEGTPPPGFKGEVVVRVIARDQDGREAVQTFKIVVGTAGQGNIAPGQRGGEGQGQGQGEGQGQPQGGEGQGQPQGAPGQTGDSGPMDGVKQANAKPVGRPSLTEQLHAFSFKGGVARQIALFEAVKRGGKAA
ncbi:DUF4347 domain-containing protein [Magnetospirillum gryphiswaldense]|nr:DUF4347 domain-containing protein [Magnetospirillum gryphiswaldense]